MGYDLRTVQEPTAVEQDTIDRTRRHLEELSHALVAWELGEQQDEFDHAATERAWEAAVEQRQQAELVCYLRLTNWDMGVCRRIMAVLGMVADVEAPPAPEPAAYGLAGTPVMDAEMQSAPSQDCFLAAADAARAHDHGCGTIPLYKLGTNDRWLVTIREINAALSVYDSQPRTAELLQDPAWTAWVAFLRHAAQRGGFTVH